jgi:hypothetical protein
MGHVSDFDRAADQARKCDEDVLALPRVSDARLWLTGVDSTVLAQLSPFFASARSCKAHLRWHDHAAKS